ncbi:hypothetical protein HGM15179_001531 [Zosterops borbonicus]|uniref:Reverse transcriptase domain-containing protein n=1 Tax=Zosterops borbonicus TaxID=364589 RepID=A0A8K1LTG8_9PASS|nr:hypothetical protein HGM15179_001531 [Zosterops borbonicus]
MGTLAGKCSLLQVKIKFLTLRNEMHPKVLRESVAVIANPFSIIFERSLQSSEVPGGWKRGNIVLIFKRGRKEDPENNCPVSLPSVLGKIMEQILSEALLRHMEDREEIWDSQHGFTKGQSCLPNPGAFHDGEIHQWAWEGFCLGSCKVFGTVPHNILLSKLERDEFDCCSLWWMRKWLDSCTRGWWLMSCPPSGYQ